MIKRTTPRKNSRISSGYYINKPSENIAPATVNGSGIIQHLPSIYLFNNNNNNSYHQRQQNPPLLPLPILPFSSSSSPINRGLSCPLLPPPTNTRKTNRDHSLTPKKSKSKPTSAKVSSLMMKSSSQSMVIASTNRLGPDPNDLPKALTTKKSSSSVCSVVNLVEDLHTFSGSVFSLAPPPSSLPLPRFSLKPKLSCNAEAAGIDAGATDNLRRLLRLR
ncbi:pectinesterase inhibitor 10 isoform X2 [Cannabis sativa]|nr:pectinesterase inhibitor 10 isoform X2 [Cannabis sativa]